MRDIWIITNPNSGTATPAKCEALEAVFGERGLSVGGRTDFPDQPLPDSRMLDRAGVDTVVLFAGDGTVNATLCELADWQGAFLILPGGTMNMLAKALHASNDPAEIIHAAHERARQVALPYVEAGKNRAFVGLILGPAANWFRAREMIRAGKMKRTAYAVRYAWRRTFGDTVRVAGVSGLRGGYQAVFAQPQDAGMAVAGIDAREWRSIIDLGWNWLTGDWLEAGAVTHRSARALTIVGRKPVLGLFDGEPVVLDPGTMVTVGSTEPRFLSTRGETA